MSLFKNKGGGQQIYGGPGSFSSKNPTGKQPAAGPNRGNGNGNGGYPDIESVVQQMVNQAIAGQTVINDDSETPMGGVAGVPGFSRAASFVRLTFDNSGGGAPVDFRFGSELGAALAGIDSLPRATGGSNDVTAIYESFALMPVLVSEIHMKTSSDADQLEQNFFYNPGTDIDGSSQGSQNVPFALAARPTYQNDLLLILKATKQPWRFGQLEQGVITVLDGETVTLTLKMGVLSHR